MLAASHGPALGSAVGLLGALGLAAPVGAAPGLDRFCIHGAGSPADPALGPDVFALGRLNPQRMAQLGQFPAGYRSVAASLPLKGPLGPDSTN